MTLFDFDHIQIWGPALSEDAGHLVPASVVPLICSAQPEYIEDAAQILFSDGCPAGIFADFVTDWLRARTIAAYHGSRLDDQYIADIRRNGLRVLAAKDRREHLQKKLSQHPRWEDAESKLDAVLDQLGARNSWGKKGRAGSRDVVTGWHRQRLRPLSNARF